MRIIFEERSLIAGNIDYDANVHVKENIITLATSFIFSNINCDINIFDSRSSIRKSVKVFIEGARFRLQEKKARKEITT